jgi:hypothetical protein
VGAELPAHHKIKDNTNFFMSSGGAVGRAASYGLDNRRGRSSSPGKVENFNFSESSRPGLGPTQPPIQSEQGVVSLRGKAARLQLVPRLRKRGSIHPLPIRLHGVVFN